MTNVTPEPDATNPFRRAFGDRARDPASVSDAMRQAEQDDWERKASQQEIYGLDNMLLGPPLIYLLSFIKNLDVSLFAYLLWPLAHLFWTPWLILRVDNARPPGDTARATAFLGYAQLGWPLSALAIEIMPVKWEFLTAFPVVFLWSVTFATLGVWRRAPEPPSSRRAWMLTGGVLAYFACALWLGVLVFAAQLNIRLPSPLGGLLHYTRPVFATVAVLFALPGVFLAPVAVKTWRRAAGRHG